MEQLLTPMTAFPSLYRERVVPRLERACRVHGTFVALGIEDFGTAIGDLYATAHRFGGGHLPDHLHARLIDWIDTRLLRHAAAAATLADAHAVIADRVADETDAWEAACQTTTIRLP